MRSLPGVLRTLRARLPGGRADHRAIFTRIYQRNEWGSEESVSGLGSTRARGADFNGELLDLLRRLDARVLLDAPCGDFNWIEAVADGVEQYVGVDVVPELISHNVQHHQRDGRSFLLADLTRDPLPRADVILCRDCLVHFSFADIMLALENFRRSGATYLLTTTFVEHETNADIRTGGWRPLNLQRPPFDFPAPLDVVDERCLHSGGIYRDKRLALWALDSISAHG